MKVTQRHILVLSLILIALSNVVSAPVPKLQVVSQSDAVPTLPNTDVWVNLLFDNRGGTSFGYGPIIDAIIPEGLTVTSVKVYGQDTEYTITQGTNHPLLDGVTLDKFSNETLVTIELPFLSYAHDLPPTPITITMRTSADYSGVQSVRGRTAFWRGTDALNNQGTDPPIYDGQSVTQSHSWLELASFGGAPPPPDPAILGIEGTDYESVVTRGTEYGFPVRLNLPENRTYSDAAVKIHLPDSVAYSRIVITPNTVGVSNIAAPAVTGLPVVASEGTITVNFTAPLAGTVTLNDVVMMVYFMVPVHRASGQPVIPPTGSLSAIYAVTAEFSAFEESIYSAFAGRQRTVSDTIALVFNHAADYALSWAIGTNTGPAGCVCCARADVCAPGTYWTPGDTLTYSFTLPSFSDFYDYATLEVGSSISDGQSLSLATAPSLEYVMGNGGGPTTVPFTVGDSFQSQGAALGVEGLFFNITRQLELAGIPNGHFAGSGSLKITYNTVVDDTYDMHPRAGGGIYHGEDLEASARILSANVVNRTNGHPLGSQTVLPTVDVTPRGDRGVLVSQELYAIDGVVCPGSVCNNPEVVPNSEITYRVRYDLPFSSTESLTISIFLPFPILDASGMTVTGAIPQSGVPPLNAIHYGPDDTYFAIYGSHPTRTVVSASNRVDFEYPAFNDVQNRQSQVDLLFTLKVSTVTGFPDGSNVLIIGTTFEGSSGNSAAASAASSQVVMRLREPVLEFWTTALRLDKSQGSLNPAMALDSVLDSAGTCTSPFTAANFLDDDVLESSYPVSSVVDIDAGDIITLATIIRNKGGAPAFKVRLKFGLPGQFARVDYATGSHLCAFNGRRQAIGVTTVTSTAAETVYTLNDISSVTGAVNGKDDGTNVVVILHKVRAASDLTITELPSVHESSLTEYYGGPLATDNHIIGTPSRRDIPSSCKQAFWQSFDVTHTTLPLTLAQYYTPSFEDLAEGEEITVTGVFRIPDGKLLNFVMYIESALPLKLLSHNFTVGASYIGQPVPPTSTLPDRRASVDSHTVTNPSDDLVDAKDDYTLSATFLNTNCRAATGCSCDHASGPGSLIALRAVETDGGFPGSRQLVQITETVRARICYQYYFPSGGSSSWSVPPPTQPSIDACDAMTMRVVIYHCSGSTAVAYDIQVEPGSLSGSDPYAYSLQPSGNIQHLAGPAIAAPVPTVTVSGAASTRPGLRYDIPELPVGQVLSLEYTIVANQSHMQPFTSRDHDTSIAYYSVPRTIYTPGDACKAEHVHTHTRSVKGASITSLALVASSQPSTQVSGHVPARHYMAIGERATIQLTVRFPEVTSDLSGNDADNLVLSLVASQATEHFEILSHRIVSTGGNLETTGGAKPPTFTATLRNLANPGVTPNEVSYLFPQLVNLCDGNVNTDDDIVIEFEILLPDLPAWTNGKATNLLGSYLHSQVMRDSSTLTMQVVEPVIDVRMSVNASIVDAGDSLLYTVTLVHDSASRASIYNVSIVNDLSSDLSVLCHTLQATPSSVAISFDTTACQSSGQVLAFVSQYHRGQSLEFTYVAAVNVSLAPAKRLLSDTSVSGTSALSSPARTYTDEVSVEVMSASPSTKVTIFDHTLGATMSSHFEPTSMDLAVGEQIVLQIDQTLPEGTMFIETNLTLPLLPGRLRLVNATVVFVGNSIADSLLIAGSNATPQNNSQVAFFDFGTIRNLPNGVENEDDHLVMHVVAEVVDEAVNRQGVNMEVKITTAFQLGDIVCYDTTWDGGSARQILTPVMIPDRSAVDFYSYDFPRGASANTGMEKENTILMYFVIDNTNQTAFVLVHDKSPNPSGGEVYTTITSDSLAGLDIKLMVQDDSHGAQDQYSWDINTGTGTFHHVWATCCTDGMVLGYFPQTEYCFRPSFNIVRGISQVALMVQDEHGNLQYTYIDLNKLNALQVCGHTCNGETRTLSSYSNILKFDVVEPKLLISLVANATLVDAGDSVQFTYTIMHTGGCPASCAPVYDLKVEIDPRMWTWIPGTMASSAGHTVVEVSSGQPTSSTVSHYIAQLNEGQAVTVSFVARINQDVIAGKDYNTVSVLQYDSHFGSRGRSDSESSTEVLSVRTPRLQVPMQSIQPPETQALRDFYTSSLIDMPVGRPFKFELDVIIIEGRDDLVLSVTGLPEHSVTHLGGTLYQYGSLTNASTPQGTAMAVRSVMVSGTARNGLFIAIPDVNNLYNNDPINDYIRFHVSLQVADVPSNSPGDVLTVMGNLTYATGAVMTQVCAMDIVQPLLVLTESANTTNADAGDWIQYTLTGVHAGTSTADAYNVTIDHTLPKNVTLIASSISCNLPCSVDAITTRTFRISVFRFVLDVARSPLVVTSVVQVNRHIGTGSFAPLDSSADVNYLTWPTADGRSLQTDSSHSVAITPALHRFAIDDTSLYSTSYNSRNANVTIGEEVRVRLVFSLPEGEIDSSVEIGYQCDVGPHTGVIVVDSVSTANQSARVAIVHSSAGYPSVSLTAFPPAPPIPGPSHSAAVQTFGALFVDYDNHASDTIGIVSQVRLVDHPFTQRGQSVRCTSVSRIGATVYNTDVVTVHIQEASLEVALTGNITSGDAGDSVLYTLIVKHTAVSDAAAYNVTIDLPLPPTLALDAGSITTTHGSVKQTKAVVNNTVAVAISMYPLGSQPITVSFIARLTPLVVPDNRVALHASAQWFTAWTNARHLTASATNSQVVIQPPTIATLKAWNSSISTTGVVHHRPGVIDVGVGEVVTYQLDGVLTEGTVNTTLQLTMSTGLVVFEPTGSAWVVRGGNLALLDYGNVASIPVVYTDTNGDGVADVVTATVGRVVNQPDNVMGTPRDTISLFVQGRVKPNSDTVNGRQFTVTGDFDYSSGTVTTLPVHADIVEPGITIDLASNVTLVDAGDILSIRANISNTLPKTSPLFNTTLVLQPQNGVVFVLTESPPRCQPSCVILESHQNGMTLRFPTLYPADQVAVTVDLQVHMSKVGYPLREVSITAKSEGYSHNAQPSRKYVSVDEVTLPVDFRSQFLAVRVSDSSLVSTGLSKFDTQVTDLAIGEAFVYELDIRLSEGLSKLVFHVEPNSVAGITFTNVSLVHESSVTVMKDPEIVRKSDSTKVTIDGVLNPGDNVNTTGDYLKVYMHGKVTNNDQVLSNGFKVVTAISLDDGVSLSNKTIPFEIVEPVLHIAKRANVTYAIAEQARSLHDLRNGSVIEYTLTVGHATGQSHSDAWEVLVQDTSSDTVLIPGSVTTSAGFVLVGNGASDTRVAISLPRYTLGSPVVELRYLAHPSPLHPLGTDMVNTANVTYASAPSNSMARDYNTSASHTILLLQRGPNIIALVADDPDDLDRSLLSVNDTITVYWSHGTTQPNVTSRSQLLSEFWFSHDVGDISGSWTNASTLVITVTGGPALIPESALLSSFQIKAVGNITTAGQLTSASRSTSPVLTGDLGRRGPAILQLTVNDPDDLDAIYSANDTVTITFSEATNQVNVGSHADVHSLLSFPGGSLGDEVSGEWTDPATLVLTVVRTVSSGPVPSISTLEVRVKGPLRDASNFTLVSRAVSPPATGNWGLRAGPGITRLLADDPDDGDRVFSVGDVIYIGFDRETNRRVVNTTSAVDDLISFSQKIGSEYSGHWIETRSAYPTDFLATTPRTRDVLSITVHNTTSAEQIVFGAFHVVVKRTSEYDGLRDRHETTFASVAQSPVLRGDFGARGPVVISFVADDPDDGDQALSVGDTLTISFDIDTNTPVIGTGWPDVSKVISLSNGGLDVSGAWQDARTIVLTILSTAQTADIGSLTVSVSSAQVNNQFNNATRLTSSSATLSGDWGQRHGPYITSAIASDPDNLDGIYSNSDVIRVNFSEPTDQSGDWRSVQVAQTFKFNEAMGRAMTGTWVNSHMIVLTVVDSVGSNEPRIGQVTIGVYPGVIRDKAQTSAYASQHGSIDVLLTGNWGAVSGPAVISLTGRDPDNGDAIFGDRDEIVVAFSQPTNQVPVSTKQDIDALFAWSLSIGSNYTGKWNSNSVLTITVVNATSTSETPRPFWNRDGSYIQGKLTASVRVSSGLRSADGQSLPALSPSPVVTGDWGLKSGPKLSLLEVADPDNADATFGEGDVIRLSFDQTTNMPSIDNSTMIDRFVFFQSNASAPQLQLAQTTTADVFQPLSLGAGYTGTWTSSKSLEIGITNATGASNIPADPSDLIVRLKGFIQDPTETSLPIDSTSTDLADAKTSARNWGLLPGPTIASTVARDPDNQDNVYGDGDTLTITFNEVLNIHPTLNTTRRVDSVFFFNRRLGTEYTGTWSGNDTCIITIVNSTAHANPDVGVLVVTTLPSAGLKNLAGLSLASASNSPPLTGSWGTFDPNDGADLIGGGVDGVQQLTGECRTFWCRYAWLLVVAMLFCLVGIALLVYFARTLRKVMEMEAERRRLAALAKKPQTPPAPKPTKKAGLPALVSAVTVGVANKKKSRLPSLAVKPKVKGLPMFSSPIASNLVAKPVLKSTLGTSGTAGVPSPSSIQAAGGTGASTTENVQNDESHLKNLPSLNSSRSKLAPISHHPPIQDLYTLEKEPGTALQVGAPVPVFSVLQARPVMAAPVLGPIESKTSGEGEPAEAQDRKVATRGQDHEQSGALPAIVSGPHARSRKEQSNNVKREGSGQAVTEKWIVAGDGVREPAKLNRSQNEHSLVSGPVLTSGTEPVDDMATLDLQQPNGKAKPDDRVPGDHPLSPVQPAQSVESLVSDDLPELDAYYVQDNGATPQGGDHRESGLASTPMHAGGAFGSGTGPRVIRMRDEDSSDESERGKDYNLSRLETAGSQLPGALDDGIRVVTERRSRGGSQTPRSIERQKKKKKGRGSRRSRHDKPLPDLDRDTGVPDDVSDVEETPPMTAVAPAESTESPPVADAEQLARDSAPPASSPPVQPAVTMADGASLNTASPSEVQGAPPPSHVTPSEPAVEEAGEAESPSSEQVTVVDLRKNARDRKRQAREAYLKKRRGGKGRKKKVHDIPLPDLTTNDTTTDATESVQSPADTIQPVQTEEVQPEGTDEGARVDVPAPEISSQSESKQKSKVKSRRSRRPLPTLPAEEAVQSDQPSPQVDDSPYTTPGSPRSEDTRPAIPMQAPPQIPPMPPPALPSASVPTKRTRKVLPVLPESDDETVVTPPAPATPGQDEGDDGATSVRRLTKSSKARKRLPTPPPSSSSEDN